ncbi:N-acetylmuramoyl-L-alanine amidase [Amylibacter marinus]|uniref:N-acetylmuramoyl-L-alanine amidase n=1 Tax=Amylibacter marinus TaxID=1475483 RepID=A0ABQ5VT69_9RHOB|nr:N-acetylmuramoyl-L-alanine amidase [Amylibacter marinus]GLQ34352.1 N-acetylmuramoyl-L-alanine amidase [Amylibacter marinus]
MKRLFKTLICGVVIALAPMGIHWADAQELRAIARINPDNSSITDRLFGGVRVRLSLSQGVPYRIFIADQPKRLILDFKTLEWNSAGAQAITTSEKIGAARFGVALPEWSRLVLPLLAPMGIETAQMSVDKSNGNAELLVELRSVSEASFHAQVSSSQSEIHTSFAESGDAAPIASGPLMVAIDPGHGGVDPGAVVQGYKEKDLVLRFARELKEALIRTGRYSAELTRGGDDFVSLTGRIERARHMGADVFLSLHADALARGSASGITVYTLSAKASSEAAAQLAAHLDRADLLAGVDLEGTDETIATVLMDIVRVETEARSNALASELVEGIAASVNRSRKRPKLSAAFTVLKAPDIPSVLIELGFITSKRDLRNLLNEAWREQVVNGIIASLDKWALADAAQADLLRK